ncbi:hypothetical protein D9758_011548 [Tetrapyrgos nigripes]|uniref:Major facilitator superfamily (MFS) profile domain-containing protein n=1 Tax=Tetrapyrgos nigripes TaxID=182062 RepID=A0A8H5CPA1_9AGAR|nr:hypothetical protein D9758_011548 [Tetrapyrgos nigripes]
MTLIMPGNARVAGLQQDLGMTDHHPLQLGSCKKLKNQLDSDLSHLEPVQNHLWPGNWEKVYSVWPQTIWGVIVTLQGLVTSYAGLVVARAILGAIEGPMFPGIVLYLSGFYTQKELSIRLLAAAIVNMEGVGGKVF